MTRKACQILRRGSIKWLVRIFVGRDQETLRQKYVDEFIDGKLRSAQASGIVWRQGNRRPRRPCLAPSCDSGFKRSQLPRIVSEKRE